MPTVQPPDRATIIVHFGDGLGNLPRTGKLQAAAVAWTWSGAARWYRPDEFPGGQYAPGEQEAEKQAAVVTARADKERANFDLRGRVRSLRELMRAKRTALQPERPVVQEHPPGPPPGYTS
jgi:hypothetical protein